MGSGKVSSDKGLEGDANFRQGSEECASRKFQNCVKCSHHGPMWWLPQLCPFSFQSIPHLPSVQGVRSVAEVWDRWRNLKAGKNVPPGKVSSFQQRKDLSSPWIPQGICILCFQCSCGKLYQGKLWPPGYDVMPTSRAGGLCLLLHVPLPLAGSNCTGESECLLSHPSQSKGARKFPCWL